MAHNSKSHDAPWLPTSQTEMFSVSHPLFVIPPINMKGLNSHDDVVIYNINICCIVIETLVECTLLNNTTKTQIQIKFPGTEKINAHKLLNYLWFGFAYLNTCINQEINRWLNVVLYFERTIFCCCPVIYNSFEDDPKSLIFVCGKNPILCHSVI